MRNKDVVASAPGSLMLFGEHAVLKGAPAIVASIDKRLRVGIQSRGDDLIKIHSSPFGLYETSREKLLIEKPYTFILATLKRLNSHFSNGFDIEIESEISSRVGLGSSSAVTVSLIWALSHMLRLNMSLTDSHQLAYQVVLDVQGYGSGADLAASLFGGVILYRMEPLLIERLKNLFPIKVIFSGYKTPTPEVIKFVQESLKNYPELYQKIFDAIGHCSLEAKEAIEKKEWSKLGEVMNINRSLMKAMNIEDKNSRILLDFLLNCPAVLGAKISGSGLGDCVISLAEKELQHIGLPEVQDFDGMELIDVKLSRKGVKIEKG